MPSGNKPLPGPILTSFYDATYGITRPEQVNFSRDISDFAEVPLDPFNHTHLSLIVMFAIDLSFNRYFDNAEKLEK